MRNRSHDAGLGRTFKGQAGNGWSRESRMKPSFFCRCRVLPRGLAATGLTLALGSLLSSCAVGPDFQRPAAPAGSASFSATALPPATRAANSEFGAAQQFVQGLDVSGRWWTQFHSPALDALVEDALKSNPDLAAAQAALRVAQENAYAQEGVFYPNVQAAYAGSRQKNPVGTVAPTLTSGVPVFNLHTAQLNVGFVPDVFGGNRRQLESLQAQAEAQRYQTEATYLTLISNLVVTAVNEAALRGQIKATRDVIVLQRQQLDLLNRQNALGAVAAADVLAQESLLAQTQATLPPLEKQLEILRHALVALSGHLPSEDQAGHFELHDLTLPQQLPVSLPSKLVQQRPDVRAAEAQLHVASAQIGVAFANRLPQFSIMGSAGGTSTILGDLFGAGNTFWSLGASVSQPVFDAGTLKHRQRAAESFYDQSAQQYRSTVLSAFQNVADALTALQKDADILEAASRADQAAAASLEVARKGVEIGSFAYVAVINAEQTYLQVHTALVQAQASRFADTAGLFQALGGGWWNRQDVVSTAAP